MVAVIIICHCDGDGRLPCLIPAAKFKALDVLGFGEWVGQILMVDKFPFCALYLRVLKVTSYQFGLAIPYLQSSTVAWK